MRSRLGSSPLTRGKLDGHVAHLDGDRLIPAHAGKTSCACRAAAARAAHPRSRGENEPAPLRRGIALGSSPLTRGKPLALVPGADHGRLIPAHAGKTCPRTRPCAKCAAHPRSRGENPRAGALAAPEAGSSPLTRGKRARAAHLRAAHGLIPAHAGKTVTHGPPPRPPAAHPRSRGENETAGRRKDRPSGSSPLTRGKPRRSKRRSWRSRLIPAHAGKTHANAGTT